jgi:hypothetical protein
MGLRTKIIHAGERTRVSEDASRVIHMTSGDHRDHARLLDFEASWPQHSGRKEIAIRAELGIPPARFYQLLRRAAASLEGQAHDAVTAHRVLRRAA